MRLCAVGSDRRHEREPLQRDGARTRKRRLLRIGIFSREAPVRGRPRRAREDTDEDEAGEFGVHPVDEGHPTRRLHELSEHNVHVEREHVAEPHAVGREARRQLTRGALVVEGLGLGEEGGVEGVPEPRDELGAADPEHVASQAGGHRRERADDRELSERRAEPGGAAEKRLVERGRLELGREHLARGREQQRSERGQDQRPIRRRQPAERPPVGNARLSILRFGGGGGGGGGWSRSRRAQLRPRRAAPRAPRRRRKAERAADSAAANAADNAADATTAAAAAAGTRGRGEVGRLEREGVSEGGCAEKEPRGRAHGGAEGAAGCHTHTHTHTHTQCGRERERSEKRKVTFVHTYVPGTWYLRVLQWVPCSMYYICMWNNNATGCFVITASHMCFQIQCTV